MLSRVETCKPKHTILGNVYYGTNASCAFHKISDKERQMDFLKQQLHLVLFVLVFKIYVTI